MGRYVPLCVVPEVVFNSARILRIPGQTAIKLSRSIFQSGMMLATYIFAMKSSICFFRYITPHNGGSLNVIAGIVGGLGSGTGLLWEPEGRRQELAIYVLPQTLIVLWNMLKRIKLARFSSCLLILWLSL
eukprot:m.117349 g.117349  ORF g.117349 m.117349 type:complete len:130 (-) comp14247_c0_seq4:496-885(-)